MYMYSIWDIILDAGSDTCIIMHNFYQIVCPLFAVLSLLSEGVKFIAITDKQQQKVPDLLRKIYELYSDYVLKNPFYSLDMPIK